MSSKATLTLCFSSLCYDALLNASVLALANATHILNSFSMCCLGILEIWKFSARFVITHREN